MACKEVDATLGHEKPLGLKDNIGRRTANR